VAERPAGAFAATEFVTGQVARQPVTAGELITAATLGATNGVLTEVTVPPGFVAMSVRVNQTSGVGTLVKAGDFIDLVTGFTAENMKLVIPDLENTTDDVFVYGSYPSDQYNGTSVKALAQGIQVLGTVLPPPPTDANGQPVAAANNVVVLNDREQLLIVSVPTQLAELVKFAQMQGDISIVLRSSEDCTTEPVDLLTYCPTVATTGITLRRVVDDFGVLPPTIVQVIEPTPLPGTVPNNLGPGGNNP
jgi:Flp pilus assembly protein CpaB